jgi:hypothetical protein
MDDIESHLRQLILLSLSDHLDGFIQNLSLMHQVVMPTAEAFIQVAKSYLILIERVHRIDIKCITAEHIFYFMKKNAQYWASVDVNPTMYRLFYTVFYKISYLKEEDVITPSFINVLNNFEASIFSEERMLQCDPHVLLDFYDPARSSKSLLLRLCNIFQIFCSHQKIVRPTNVVLFNRTLRSFQGIQYEDEDIARIKHEIYLRYLYVSGKTGCAIRNRCSKTHMYCSRTSKIKSASFSSYSLCKVHQQVAQRLFEFVKDHTSLCTDIINLIILY